MPTTFDKIGDQSLDYIEPMLSNQALDKDQRASLISKYSKTITQYKFDLMALHLDTIQSIIRGHEHSLHDLQMKLSQSSCYELMIQVIENRQQTMRKRHEIYLQRKLDTFSTKLRRHSTNEAVSWSLEQSIVNLYNNNCFSTIY